METPACICSNEDYIHHFTCKRCKQSNKSMKLDDIERKINCPTRSHCPFTVCGFQELVCEDCQAEGWVSRHDSGGGEGFVQIKKPLLDRLKDIYLSDKLYDHERRNNTFNLLICEWSSLLKKPRDGEPAVSRISEYSGFLAPYVPTPLKPQKTIAKKKATPKKK
jgi:hypothetical protein